MDLKEIHLNGFKSFADKTVIRFDEGVTCIVGPNGCGKSNVSDAVRWVLGEQSAKSLRGSSMQDVIFNGSEERKPHNFCEVTLVFDNSNHIFDMDCPDVAMTRRLYKNGDSKYLINDQPSRLKDIVRLFHSIGLGKEGYSIIGQGNVQQIMSAKPSDRRVVFEEATGIMVYKASKKDIENKLEDATDNLNIYRQRIDEAERHLGPLEKQAEDAKIYHNYSSQLKEDEANTYIYRFENAEGEKGKFKKDIASISDEIISLNVKISKVNRQSEENREKISAADVELSSLNDKRVELSVGNERKGGELKLVQEKIHTYREKIDEANKIINNGKVRIGEIDDEIAFSDQKKKENEAKIVIMGNEKDTLKSVVSALDNKIELFEKLSDEKRLNQLSSADNLSELKRNIGTLSARKESTLERINEIQKALDNVTENRDGLKEEISAVRNDLKRLKNFSSEGIESLEEQNEEVQEMTLTVNKFNQDLFAANGQLASLRDSLELYINLKNRFEGYKESVRRLLYIGKTNNDIGKRIKGSLADIIRTEQKYEIAIETALGGAMQNVVTANSDDARYLIEYLKRSNGGVVTFLPVENMRPRADSREIRRALDERGAMGLATELVKYDDYYYNVISYFLGNTLICDNIFNATAISKKYGNMFKIVTLDGDTIQTSGAMTGGSRKKDTGSLLSNERKINECKEKINAKNQYIEKLKKAIEESERAKKEAEAEVEKLREKYQYALTELATLEQRESALVQQIERAEEDIKMYGDSIKDLKEKLKSLEMEEVDSAQNEEKLNSMRASVEEELASQKSQCDAFREERNEKDKKLRNLEVDYTSLISEMKKSEENTERINKEKEKLIKLIMNTQEEMDGIQTELDNLESIAREKELTEEEKAAVQEIVEKIATIVAEKDKINELQAKLEEEKTALQESISKYSDKRYKCEVEISKIDTNLENMRLRMEEAYNMDYEQCLAFRKDSFNVEEAANEISVLKRKITMLGDVNPNAVQEFADEKTHYDEMITQRDDLQKAIEDLTVALNDVRNEMLRIFNEGFDKINENFKVTFKELFGGGKAELQLDYADGEDPLEAGVEIAACPPGKKLTKISLLSGGEKALTAIAILFAILKSRPMPFCILDEIEAALDEANVDRFAAYLKRFSKETQFIVITHRKPTMNQADSLFGVTMQEKGVSKLVSVKLEDVETRLGKGTVE